MELYLGKTLPPIGIVNAQGCRDRQEHAHQAQTQNNCHQEFVNTQLVQLADQMEQPQSGASSDDQAQSQEPKALEYLYFVVDVKLKQRS